MASQDPRGDGRGQVAEPSWYDEDSWDWTEIPFSVAETPVYKQGVILGRGGGGVVRKVLRVADGRVFAGKESAVVEVMVQEARVLRSLKHKRILKYVDLYEEKDNPKASLLVTELCEGGVLQTRISNATGGMKAEDTLRVVHQIAGALAYLHARGLFHTDVKPQNILITTWSPIEVVLADCADVRKIGRARKLIGTKKFYSPEMVRRKQHSGPGDDIWALGLTMMSMLGKAPHMIWTRQGLRAYPQRCVDHAQDLKMWNARHELVALMARMLALEEEDRPTAAECEKEAGELLGLLQRGEARWGQEGDLGIELPPGFEPVTFW